MNKQETTQIITLLAGNYEAIANKSQVQRQMMLNTWYECLNDLDYKLVLQAVKKTIIDSPFTPTIHDIRKNAIELMHPVIDNRLDAWDECFRLISRASVVTQEELDSASHEVQKFIGSIGQLRTYGMSDIDTINTVVKSSFLKQYELLKQREKEQKLLPQNMQNIVKKLANKMSVKQLN